MAELVAISSVWPSGAAFATAFTPTCWPAPGRFSTTNGLPIRCSQTCAAMRASRSVEPAGVNGTITVMVLDGQSCADAGMIAANKARKGHSSHRGVMGMPPVERASGDEHAPVELVAARRPAVAPPSAIGLEAPVVLADARNHLDTDAVGARHWHAHCAKETEQKERPLAKEDPPNCQFTTSPGSSLPAAEAQEQA